MLKEYTAKKMGSCALKVGRNKKVEKVWNSNFVSVFCESK